MRRRRSRSKRNQTTKVKSDLDSDLHKFPVWEDHRRPLKSKWHMISDIKEDVKLITKSLNWALVMGQPGVSHILPWLLNLVYRNDNKLKIQFVSFLTHKIVICLQAVGWKKYPDISCFRLKLLCGLCYLWLWFSTNIRHPPIHSSNCCLSVSNKQILMRCSYCEPAAWVKCCL